MTGVIRYLLLPWNLAFRPLRPWTGPLHIQLEPTNACNQKCLMCTRDRLIQKTEFLKEEGFRKILEEIRPRKMNLSGLGEPFLHPGIFDFIRLAREKGTAVTLATNFTLLEGKVEELIASGINEVKVSLDSAEPETYKRIRRGAGSREKVISTLEELKRKKAEKGVSLPVVRINFALQAANAGQLVPLIRTARSLGAESIYVQYLDYVDMEDRKPDLVRDLEPGKLRALFLEARRAAEEEGITHNLDIWLRDLSLYANKMGPAAAFRVNGRVCYFPWITTFIEAGGDVKPCPIFVWKRGVGRMGNIYETPFSEIWRGEAYREVRRDLRKGKKVLPPCRQCIPQTLGNIFALYSKLHPGWNKKS